MPESLEFVEKNSNSISLVLKDEDFFALLGSASIILPS
jgi:hypothetical protein